MSPWRIAAWIIAAFVLLLPVVAMPFTPGVDWTASGFVVAAVLLFGALGAYELAARKADNAAYRAGVGVAIAAALLLTWVNAAVGLTDSSADGLYLGVIAVGIIGAVIARFRPEGMARALFATALALGVVSILALVAGGVPNDTTSAFEVVGLTGFFVALFAGSAGLFRRAAHGRVERG
ncbi:MAG: hypothetical protein GVY35_11845 [Bacteroidetes bacterium]|nr:hypothetical protein [Bacteroidota bacterium]